MEPKLVRKDIKYQKKTLIIVSVLVISLFIGGSFALLSNSAETKDVVTFSTGNFNLEVATTGTLSLEGEVPKSYEDGFKSNDITLTLTNTGTLEIGKYEVKLEGDTGTTLDANYIRYSVSDDDGKTYLASKLLSETNNIIYTGYSLKTTKELKVKLWIDEEAGENALKKIYNGKIKVELYQNDDTFVDVVKSKLVSNYSGSNESFPGGVVAVNSDGNLYHEVNNEEIREYRYSGPTVNNYVTFNDELWRIVGVFKDEAGREHVKIVRNTKLEVSVFPETYTINGTSYIIKDNDGGALIYWNHIIAMDYSDWNEAGLQYFLNTEHDDNGTRGYLNFLSDDVKEMVEDTKYYLGNVNTNTLNNITVDNTIESYNHERGKNTCSTSCSGGDIWEGRSSEWTGKIALMYPSDLGYSAKYNFWKDIKLNNYDESAWGTSWLKEIFKEWQWLLSPSTFMKNRGSDWSPQGNINSSNDKSNRNFVQPALSLKNNVKITSGDGTKENPYKLILE